MIVFRVRGFLVIALDELDTVRHRSCGNQERNDQGQRIEVEAEERDNSQSPGRGNQDANNRQDNAVNTATEIHEQQRQQNRQRQEENLHYLVEITVHPAHQDRLSGRVYFNLGRSRRRLLCFHLFLEVAKLPEYLDVVELALIEGASYQD